MVSFLGQHLAYENVILKEQPSMYLAKILVFVLTLAITAPFAAAQAKSPVPDGIQCRDLPALFQVYTQVHYLVKKVDESIEKQTTERFVKMIDPSKSLLLATDVQNLQNELPKVFADSGKGDCQRLNDAWSIVRRRAAEDEQLARQLLTAKFKLDDNTRIVMDTDKRQYAKTDAARSRRVRDMIQFQISNYLVAGLSMDQAKSQLLHRYGLVGKRMAERQNKGKIPWLWAEAFAEALDPHSAYMAPDELADFEISMKLSLEGIGAQLRTEDGFTVIQSLVPGGQAEKTGQLQAGDKIIAVAQEGEKPVSTIDMESNEVVKMIRGKKGTKVTLTILREVKEAKTFLVTIVRDKIDVSSQAAKITYDTRKIGDRTIKIGIIDLPSFYGGEKGGRSSYADIKKLLNEAHDQKADGIVLDLSRNGGGLLDEAVRISGLFIKRGAVVATKGGDGKLRVLEDTDPDIEWPGPVAVIISPASASASEILAGALKDYRRALIIGGDKTFGKGTVQNVVSLPAEIGAVRVTTGMFFLPGGASTQLRGVTSDIQVPSVLDGFNLGEEKLDYAMPAQAVTLFLSSTANAESASNRWNPVQPAMIATLAEKSKARIATDPAFAKIREQLQDLAKNRGEVRLGDLRKRTAKEKAKKANSAIPAAKPDKTDPPAPAKSIQSQDEEDLDSLQGAVVKECVNVLADAIAGDLH
jgi:carboxyl-terminal processing protease